MNPSLASHNLNEYAQIAIFASGGASLGFQMLIRRASPSKAANVFSRILGAMPGACSPLKQASYSKKLADSITWLKSKEDFVVAGTGVATASIKACIDSRESQISSKTQEDTNRTLLAEVTSLKTSHQDLKDEMTLLSLQVSTLSRKLLQKEDENTLLRMDLAKAFEKAANPSSKRME
jgi:hypothetical protein